MVLTNFTNSVDYLFDDTEDFYTNVDYTLPDSFDNWDQYQSALRGHSETTLTRFWPFDQMPTPMLTFIILTIDHSI